METRHLPIAKMSDKKKHPLAPGEALLKKLQVFGFRVHQLVDSLPGVLRHPKKLESGDRCLDHGLLGDPVFFLIILGVAEGDVEVDSRNLPALPG